MGNFVSVCFNVWQFVKCLFRDFLNLITVGT